MARKYDLISELYDRTSKTVVSAPENWEAFLRSACHNFRLRFDEQLLIYAERPDATAVLHIERWNESFGRWVNKGAHGIAVFADENRNTQRLTHYFDISDTHESRYSRTVPIWTMKDEYTDDVIETLESTFGELEDKSDLGSAVMSAAQNAAEDNLPDYLGDLLYSVENSFLDGVSEEEISLIYNQTVTNSVAYMMMSRLGIDTEAYFEPDDFRGAVNFTTPDTLNALGFATSDIAEMGLAEVSKTILSQQRANRTFVKQDIPDYNEIENKTERSFDNERTDLYHAGRLQSAESEPARTAGGDSGTIRTDEAEISERKPQGSVLQSSDEVQADGASVGNRAESDGHGRNSDEADVADGGLNREPESTGYDGLGTANEQSEEQSAGNRDERGNLRLEHYDRRHEDNSLPFFGRDDTVREMLGVTPHLKASKAEIKAFYEMHPDNGERTEYIKEIFNTDYTELLIGENHDRRVGYKTFDNVLHLWEGSYLNRTAQSYYDWSVIAQHFEAMRLFGELQDTIKPLPSIDGQMTLILNGAEEKTSAFSFSQEIIDAVLTRGSGISEGKMRIYEQFQKSLSAKENADFLKSEYGWGGSYPVIVGTGIDEQHDGKDIRISKGIGNEKPHVDLKWNQVEKRIAELIRLDRYLNTKEKAHYPEWLEKREQQRAEWAERQKNREILRNAPPEKEKPEIPTAYEYHLGDAVYIGSNEYEILSFDDDVVKLYDTQFPLFNKEYQRVDFDRMVKENPMNDHLKVAVPQSVIETELTPWQEYSEIKERSPDTVVVYQIGNFFEVMGDDAGDIAHDLELAVIERSVGDEKIPMVGFPSFKLDENTEKLRPLGYDVLLAPLEDGERKEYLLTSTKEPEQTVDTNIGNMPVEDYREIKAVQNGFDSYEDMYNQGFRLGDELDESPEMTKAKRLINKFCQAEYESDADFSHLDEIGVGFTTVTDDELTVQANINLLDFSIVRDVEGTIIDRRQYNSLSELIENELRSLDFDDLTSVSDEQLAKLPKDETPLKPSWENKSKSKAQSFDIHPEIPMADRHTFDLSGNEVETVGKKERFRRNIMAIQLLKKCQEENRFATPDEQLILSKYVGWGGISEAFDENNSSWATEYFELRAVLDSDEYSSARESTLTAFYTPPEVVSAIYKAMGQMGQRDVASNARLPAWNILEPFCGIGNFIGMLPKEMQDSKIYGVELDTISAGIAQQLYQKSSIAAQGFEETSLPDSFFDAVVGNVPFGDFKVADKRYDKHNFLIHDYFFAKSLDKLRPGGVMALVTSKGTMDKENSNVRRYISQRADLLGAIRLPNDTFKGNAGTEVVSDILILQKRDRIIDIEPDWVRLDTDENGIRMNSYFVQHPEMILGEMKMVSGRFGPKAACIPYENADLENQLSDAVANIHGEITEYEVDDELEEDKSIPADPTVRNFSYTVVDDTIYFRENSRMTPVEASATAENRIKGLIAVRECVRQLIDYQTEDFPDEMIKSEQAKLNSLYDSFTKKYGLINSRANSSAFSQDSSYSLLSALEIIGDEGELERKADMFFKMTIKPHTPITHCDTVSEALAVSMGEKAQIDIGYMESLTDKTEEEIFSDLKGVIFFNPLYEEESIYFPKYLMADEYLSGNVREKLAIAKSSAKIYPEDYTVNVEALLKVQPKDLTASEISVRLGATWLPTEDVQDFIFELLGTPRYAQWNIKAHFSPFTSEWNIEGKAYDRSNVKAYSTYGTGRINAYKIIEETLNLRDVRIFDYVEDVEGKKKAILNKKETAIAQAKQEQIKQGFQDWIWTDPIRRERLCKLYNEKFNSLRPREYDGSHITFNGINPEIDPREHQKNAVAHILYDGNTLLAHAVGAGKTYEMTASAMEAKRLGLCSKSLFVVPNHLTEQWAAEFLQLYPAANILVATKKDFETKNRKRFCGRIATGDYDAVIIGHSQFEKIPMSIERQRAILEQQLSEITNGIIDLKANRGESFSVKQLEKSKKAIKLKLEKLNDQSRKDDVVTFEELGCDRLFIDESHYYKNLFLYTKMRNVGGIAQTEAQKSSDLFMKCRYLDELTGGRGTVFATGTPISNSMVELYTIQRYLQYNTLQRNGLQHFDAWASTFGETVTAVELTPEGTGYRAKTRFAKFYNLPELMSMFKEVADIKTADMLNLPVPQAHFHNVAVKPSEMQKEMVASLAERAEKVRGGGVDSSVDNMLKITNDGRKLALDQRMINDMLPDFEDSKVNACVDNVFDIWERSSDKKSAQLVFCDLSTPHNDGSFSVYTDIRKKLTLRGIPEEQVKFIHEADTEQKKQELFKKVRKGEVRVLLGSTAKMGAGTNAQNKLIASHDIDCPWRPSDLEQRLGRTVRQGNENPEVEIFRYVTEETFDAYLYQLVEGKQKFASQIMTSKSPVRSCEDIDETALSYAEIKSLATGNPYIKGKMDLDIQVQKLKLLKSSFLSEKYSLEDKTIKYYPQQIARLSERIENLQLDKIRLEQHPKPTDDRFVGMAVQGVSYSEKQKAGQAIINVCKSMNSPDPISLGAYRDFDLELSFNSAERCYEVKIKGDTTQSVALGDDIFGNITRIDNRIERIPELLATAKDELENTKRQFETAKTEVEKPFPQEADLKAKTARLDELNILLNMDKKENELVDSEPDEGENQPAVKQKDRER